MIIRISEIEILRFLSFVNSGLLISRYNRKRKTNFVFLL